MRDRFQFSLIFYCSDQSVKLKKYFNFKCKNHAELGWFIFFFFTLIKMIRAIVRVRLRDYSRCSDAQVYLLYVLARDGPWKIKRDGEGCCAAVSAECCRQVCVMEKAHSRISNQTLVYGAG